MDIGSIFALPKRIDINENMINKSVNLPEWGQMFSLCREVLYELAKRIGREQKVLIPAYTCSTVYEPFIQAECKCIFYNIKNDLTIDIEDLKIKYSESGASACVIHPYYGMGFTDEEEMSIQYLHDCGCIIIEDLTQSIFKQSSRCSDYITGSLRKWFPIPDGAFLRSNTGNEFMEKENPQFYNFLQDQIDAMYLRGVYFQNGDESLKQISIRLKKRAVKTTYGRITPHSMSMVSINEMLKQDTNFIVRQRMENYQFLFENVVETEIIRHVTTEKRTIVSAALYFPIYCKNRESIQRELAKEHIYAPILWPLDENTVNASKEVKEIYDTILCIPIDQRYTIDDMKRIANLLNNLPVGDK